MAENIDRRTKILNEIQEITNSIDTFNDELRNLRTNLQTSLPTPRHLNAHQQQMYHEQVNSTLNSKCIWKRFRWQKKKRTNV